MFAASFCQTIRQSITPHRIAASFCLVPDTVTARSGRCCIARSLSPLLAGLKMGNANGERANGAKETYAEKASAVPDAKGAHGLCRFALMAALHCLAHMPVTPQQLPRTRRTVP